MGDRLARERGRDSAIPSLLAEAERTDLRLQSLLQVLPRVPAANAAPAADLADRCETSRQDLRGSQSNGGNQLTDFGLAFVNQVGAGFRMLAAEEGITYREDTASHAIACVDDRDPRPFRPELACGRQPGKSGTSHENGNAAHAGRDQSAKYKPTEERSLIG